MAGVLYLLGSRDPAGALPIIAGQVAAGDAVTVAVLAAPAPALPPEVAVHRVPGELTWDQLLDLIFTADRVISW
jgi:hypothetical protein